MCIIITWFSISLFELAKKIIQARNADECSFFLLQWVRSRAVPLLRVTTLHRFYTHKNSIIKEQETSYSRKNPIQKRSTFKNFGVDI